jgi:hypothetical protein
MTLNAKIAKSSIKAVLNIYPGTHIRTVSGNCGATESEMRLPGITKEEAKINIVGFF